MQYLSVRRNISHMSHTDRNREFALQRVRQKETYHAVRCSDRACPHLASRTPDADGAPAPGRARFDRHRHQPRRRSRNCASRRPLLIAGLPTSFSLDGQVLQVPPKQGGPHEKGGIFPKGWSRWRKVARDLTLSVLGVLAGKAAFPWAAFCCGVPSECFGASKAAAGQSIDFRMKRTPWQIHTEK